MDDFLWEKEVADFIDALRKAGIDTFVYTNQSTAVMENLHPQRAVGCRAFAPSPGTRTAGATRSLPRLWASGSP